MKYYIDAEGKRYSVDRETGQRDLIQSAESVGEPVCDPKENANIQEDESNGTSS